MRAKRLLFALALAGAAAPARSWSGHGAITRLALQGVRGLDAEVPYESFEDYANSVGRTRDSLLRELELNPTAPLYLQAGETPGSRLSLAEVLEAYSDEPDQTMDFDVFSYYPGLWKDEYEYMGAKLPQGGDRLWRHGYFPGGYYKAGADGKPVLDPRPIGESPTRARLFFDRSLAAFRAGHPYWGGRFLAWSLHYVEDATQPFHSAQIPSMRLLRFDADGGVDLSATIRLIVFYHLAHEDAAKRLLAGTMGGAAVRLRSAISSGGRLASSSPEDLVRDVAASAASAASDTVKSCLSLLPDPGAPDSLDPTGRLWSQPYQDAVAAAFQSKPGEAEAFVAQDVRLLATAGDAARTLIELARAELGKSVPIPLPAGPATGASR